MVHSLQLEQNTLVKNLKSNSTASIPCICYGAKHLNCLYAVDQVNSCVAFRRSPFGKTTYFQDYRKERSINIWEAENHLTKAKKTLCWIVYECEAKKS